MDQTILEEAVLDPQAHWLLKLLLDNGVPPIHTQTPVQARLAYESRKSFSQPDPLELALVQDHWVLSDGEKIKVRRYVPEGVVEDGSGGALVYFHGGGWTIGSVESHDVLCRELSHKAQCQVFSVDYRLAPEHPFPAAYNDALAVFRWLQEQIKEHPEWGLQPDKVAIGGDSAGGNLASAACLGLLKDEIRPCFQLLIYPATNMLCNSPSHKTMARGYLLTQEAIEWFVGHYISEPNELQDFRASPLLATNHEGLPSALVLVAGFDPLKDEGVQYADVLSKAGVAVEVVSFERQIHGFITMGRILREANTAVNLCALALQKALA
jgi:acetyl esterase